MWTWGIFWQLAPDGGGTYLDTLIAGLGWTLATALWAWGIALILGMIVGVVRTTPVRWLRLLGDAWVELFRNVPLLVQMFLWFFVVPELLPVAVGTWLKQLPRSAFYTAVVCLGFYTSARVAEQVRAGIQALPRGPGMAGPAIRLTLPQTYRHVLRPLSLRLVLPRLTSE